MHSLITLIIIVHNRHSNVERLLKYYEGFLSPVIIADSSEKRYLYQNSTLDLRHIYTPGLTFTEKIEHVLQYVQTPYVAMCADDDFIIAEAIMKCVDFLENNRGYSVTQGTCLMYKKADDYTNGVEFGLLYRLRSYDLEDEDAMRRLEQMFQNYRSFLYAVHRTETVKASFKNAGAVIKNLFLNEYVTAFLPIVSGKYKELPLLYQVREFSNFSDDKTADNLDTIFLDNKYENELEGFLGLISTQVSNVIGLPMQEAKERITILLKDFSESPALGKKPTEQSLKKRLGTIAGKIPGVGQWLINKNRQIEIRINLKKAIKTDEETDALHKIAVLLKNHP